METKKQSSVPYILRLEGYFKLCKFSVLTGIIIVINCAFTDRHTLREENRQYHYTCFVSNVNEELIVVLDSLNSSVKNIQNVPQWLSIQQMREHEGHPVIQIKTIESAPDASKETDVTLNMIDGTVVKLTLSHAYYLTGLSSNNTNDEFLTNWEKQDSVKLCPTGWVYTPWNKDCGNTIIPSSIRDNVKKENGWEMAFCALNDQKMKNGNYFGLYNKYLGILRIFYHVDDAIGTGSEYSFEVNMMNKGNAKQYPFYNSLPYHIPTSCQKVSSGEDLVNSGINMTFKYWSSPYSTVSSSALQRGWIAFDVDMSGYTPAPGELVKANDELFLSCKTIQNQEVNLSGTLSANISGEYTLPGKSTSSANGSSSPLASIKNTTKQIESVAKPIIDIMKGGSPLAWIQLAGAGLDIWSFIDDKFFNVPNLNDKLDAMPGKINMSLTGSINLSGYIKSLTSNQILPIYINYQAISKLNPETSVGQGVWSLSESPVVYIVDDHFMGNPARINLIIDKPNKYGTSNGQNNEMRLVSFLDPTSIKLNINQKLFPDISNVKVMCFYGVYPNLSKGHTSKYRDLMSLKAPKQVDVVRRDSSLKIGSVFRTTDKGNKMTYHQVDKNSIVSDYLDKNPSAADTIRQKGSNYIYYGRILTNKNDPQGVLIDPQVYFPVSGDGAIIYDGEVPDFVVFVHVSFKSGGRTYQFSSRYLPNVELISSNNLDKKKASLEAYIAKCEQKVPINYLNGGSSVGIIHTDGEKLMKKTMKILNIISK